MSLPVNPDLHSSSFSTPRRIASCLLMMTCKPLIQHPYLSLSLFPQSIMEHLATLQRKAFLSALSKAFQTKYVHSFCCSFHLSFLLLFSLSFLLLTFLSSFLLSFSIFCAHLHHPTLLHLPLFSPPSLHCYKSHLLHDGSQSSFLSCIYISPTASQTPSSSQIEHTLQWAREWFEEVLYCAVLYCTSTSLSVCLSSVCLSICLSICLSLLLSTSISY